MPEITHTVEKKNLIGTCRSCGATMKNMDTVHKAGKQLHKDIPNYYAANPEFASKPGAQISVDDDSSAAAAGAGKKGKKGKK